MTAILLTGTLSLNSIKSLNAAFLTLLIICIILYMDERVKHFDVYRQASLTISHKCQQSPRLSKTLYLHVAK